MSITQRIAIEDDVFYVAGLKHWQQETSGPQIQQHRTNILRPFMVQLIQLM
jgi:hypothetical protein